jgi:hypothetical protein
MPVAGGALGIVVALAVGDGEGEVVCAKATPSVKRPETPSPAAPNAIFLIINLTSSDIHTT